MPPTDAPTTELGHAGVAGGSLGFAARYLGTIDDVVELAWPWSVVTHDRMRRDSKVSSTLHAMMLPILSADWRVNPRSARAEVVEQVADDLGLPIIDAEHRHPARTRDRFDWRFHIRHALLSRIYGFMPFEQVYRIAPDGSARLRKLAPRMPHTLAGVQVAPDGGLEGIEQHTAVGVRARNGVVQIPVDRLVMYVHEREGAGWIGTSVLRPVHRDWILKDVYHRIAAVGIERQAVGSPIFEDPPPSVNDPSGDAAEAAAGQKLAESYRAGSIAGGRIPHGAKLHLISAAGGLPVILDFIRYHDGQIAGSMLETFSALPDAPNGSRALGDTLVNFFVRSLNAHALDIATVATNHVVEDLVDLNWGPDEPAPAVECGEIGAEQQLTAQSLKMLMDAGAINAQDPAIQRYLRRFYRLPAPELPAAPPAPESLPEVVDDAPQDAAA